MREESAGDPDRKAVRFFVGRSFELRIEDSPFEALLGWFLSSNVGSIQIILCKDFFFCDPGLPALILVTFAASFAAREAGRTAHSGTEALQTTFATITPCLAGFAGAVCLAPVAARAIIALNTAFGGTASGSAEFELWAAALAALDVTAIAFAVGFAAGVEVSSSIKLLVFLHVVYNLTDHGHLLLIAPLVAFIFATNTFVGTTNTAAAKVGLAHFDFSRGLDRFS